MFELIYRSIARKELNTTDIENILKISRDFNSKNNITGCLLYHNQEFVQILEGDKKIVKDLYSNIENDTRHRFISLLGESTKKERLFDNWSMAFHDLRDDENDPIKKLMFVDNIKTFSELTEKPTRGRKLFWHLAKKIVDEK